MMTNKVIHSTHVLILSSTLRVNFSKSSVQNKNEVKTDFCYPNHTPQLPLYLYKYFF